MYTVDSVPRLYWTVYRSIPAVQSQYKGEGDDSLDSITMAISPTTVAVLAFGFLLSTYLKRRTTKRPPLPPGPPADPFIGHLRIMPSDQQELVFHEWAKTYGTSMSLIDHSHHE